MALRFFEKFGGHGFVTLEVREGKRRVGFKIRVLPTGDEHLFAHVDFPPPRIGKYGVDVRTFEEYAIPALDGEGTLIVDEIGPMELLSRKFERVLRMYLDRSEFLATVHRKIAKEWANTFHAQLIWITRETWLDGWKRLLELWGL